MRYVSTRGQHHEVNAPQAVLNGIALDGGLYMPDHLPRLELELLLSSSSYEELALLVFERLLKGYSISALTAVVQKAYGTGLFPKEVTPLVVVGEHQVLELFHGPTAAFKDLALSILPGLMASSRQMLLPSGLFYIITATSGDTGSAAMQGFSEAEGFRTLVFYPANGISAVQKAQMTTMPASNVDAVGIRGNFDDAQSGVKGIFLAGQIQDKLLPDRVKLSSANSINIGRLIPQIVYYFKAYQELVCKGTVALGEKVDFAVPTGNFGNILAGYFAREMGLPVGLFICASNQNRVLTDFLETGIYNFNRKLLASISPSMDILVSSNLERLIYMASGSDAGKVRGLMADARDRGFFEADESMMKKIREVFVGVSCSDEQALDTIFRVFHQQGYLLDPHTAAAWHAMETVKKAGKASRAYVILSTASPFKFPRAMLQALGEHVTEDSLQLIPRLENLSKQEAPDVLLKLMKMKTIHKEVISKESIQSYAMGRISTW